MLFFRLKPQTTLVSPSRSTLPIANETIVYAPLRKKYSRNDEY